MKRLSQDGCQLPPPLYYYSTLGISIRFIKAYCYQYLCVASDNFKLENKSNKEKEESKAKHNNASEAYFSLGKMKHVSVTVKQQQKAVVDLWEFDYRMGEGCIPVRDEKKFNSEVGVSI